MKISVGCVALLIVWLASCSGKEEAGAPSGTSESSESTRRTGAPPSQSTTRETQELAAASERAEVRWFEERELDDLDLSDWMREVLADAFAGKRDAGFRPAVWGPSEA